MIHFASICEEKDSKEENPNTQHCSSEEEEQLCPPLLRVNCFTATIIGANLVNLKNNHNLKVGSSVLLRRNF